MFVLYFNPFYTGGLDPGKGNREMGRGKRDIGYKIRNKV